MFEPETVVVSPYIYFPSSYHFHASHSLSIHELRKTEILPDLVTVSTSFSPEELVDFLWNLKSFAKEQIIPLLFIVNWTQPLSELPGTTWGGKIGILHTLSSPAEVSATLERIMK
jgi:hypothetical protein